MCCELGFFGLFSGGGGGGEVPVANSEFQLYVR